MTQAGDGWQTLPDDGYIYQHLAWHLMKPGTPSSYTN